MRPKPLKLDPAINELGFQPHVEGLRGLAILLVFLCHYVGNSFSFMWIGVDLFFVLSGFLITRILLNRINAPSYFRNFYARRVLRIFPLYYASLAIAIFVVPSLWPLTNVGYLQERQAWFWLYLQNFLFMREGWPEGNSFILSHFWSLAIEEQYYLFWPLLLYIVHRNRAAVIAVPLAMVVLALIHRLWIYPGNPDFYVSLFTRMDSLLIGALITILARHAPRVLETVARPVLISCGIMVAAAFVLTGDLAYTNPFFATVGYTVTALFFGALLVLTFTERSRLRGIFDTRLLKWLGRYSYGIYVIHFPVYWLARKPLLAGLNELLPTLIAKGAAALLLAAFTLLISAFSYHYFEAPMLRLKRYFE